MSYADDLAEIALRTRCASLVVATTGTMTLAATSAAFTRASGSFITDGFKVGMEVTPVGFPSTTPVLITEVSALSMKFSGTVTAATAAGSRALTVGLPAFRVYENKEYTPTVGRHYVELELVSQPGLLLSFPAAGGTREDRGLYVIRWYGIADTGSHGLRTCVSALADLFTPGTTLALTDGSTLRVRGDFAAFGSPLLKGPAGFVFLTLTVQWRRYAINAVV